MSKITKYINHSQLGIITRLTTQHIELNHFMYHNRRNWTDTPVPFAQCSHCNQLHDETIQHFLLECTEYDKQRERLFVSLKTIWNGFNDPKNRSLDNLLFPFNIRTSDNDKKPLNILFQAAIWKSVCKFVKEPKRFKDIDLYKIDLEELTS